MNWNGTVSLLIACLELLLLINLLIFAEKNKLNIIAILMITLLAAYQTLEFLMCGVELQNSFYPYSAFIVISFLPPLNLLLTLSLTRNLTLYLYTVFIPAIIFLIYYTFVISQFAVTSCTVIYAAYNYPLGELFGFFYYLPILISIFLLIRMIKKETEAKKKLILKVLLFSSVFICLPVLVAFILKFLGNSSLLAVIESAMCKFAFVYALCLGFVCLYNSKSKDERNYFKYLSGYK